MTGGTSLLLTTLVALIAICSLVLGGTLLLRRWGHPVAVLGRILRGNKPAARVVVLERIALEPRRSLYLIAADGRTILLGANEAGMAVVAELYPRVPETEFSC